MAQHLNVGVHSGKKRPAESDPDGDQPLTKKFGRLHLDSVATRDSPEHTTHSSPRSADIMMLDDTKNTVYIYDLDQELAETEVSSCSVKFLPGVEEKLSTVPRFMIADTKPKCNELVLYREPSTLVVPKEKDIVQKALVETRERARANHCEHLKSYSGGIKSVSDLPLYTAGNTDNADDVRNRFCNDAMDVDSDSLV